MDGLNEFCEGQLKRAGIRVTPNRLLVLGAVVSAGCPVSLVEIEDMLETVERSSVSRALSVLSEHHVLHGMEDGRGVVRYELCHGADGCCNEDMHVHFYCERCGHVFCLEDVIVPHVSVPSGYRITGVNYMVKGICEKCGHFE